MNGRDMEKAALRGEPSYVWRAGQERRLGLIVDAAGERLQGRVLENGCGIGTYMQHLSEYGGQVTGLEFDLQRARQAAQRSPRVTNAAGERLPFAESVFDLVLSHEVIEHVQDDREAMAEIIRVLRPGGRAVIFAPNRGYPFETHGIYWAGKYHFGNKLFVNYLPRALRDELAPHVRAYSRRDLERLVTRQPVRIVDRKVIFGAYDNLIARFGLLGRALRRLLQLLEHTPLRILGLSHVMVIERT